MMGNRKPVLINGLFLFLLIAFSVFYYRLAVHADTPLLDGDNAVYALMADYFSPFSDRPNAITELVMRHSNFPPLYPMALGLSGANSSHIAFAHAITVGFLLLAMATFFYWTRRVLDSTALAGWLVIGFGLLPVTIFQSLELLSENLYLLLSLIALLTLAKSRGDDRWVYVGALAIGLACITRSVGVTLLVAYLIHARGRERHRRWMPILISVLPLLLWTAWKFMQGYRGNYVSAFLNVLTNRSIFEYLQFQLHALSREILGGWISSFDYHASIATLIAGSMLGVVCLAGLVYRAVHRHFDAIYVTLYLAVIVVWPFPYEARRLFYPVLPILLVQGLFLICLLARRQSRMRIAAVYPYIYLAMLGLIIFPSATITAERFASGQRPEQGLYAGSPSWYEYLDLEQAKERITEQKALTQAWLRTASMIDEKECVYHVKPDAFMLYANRLSYQTPLVASNNREEFFRQTDQCRYFYLGAYIYYPYLDALYPQRFLRDYRIVSRDYLDGPGGRRLLGMLVEVARRDGEHPVPATK